MEAAVCRAGGEHAGLDALHDGVEALDLLLGRVRVVLGLGGVGVELLVGRHGGGGEACGYKVDGRLW